MDVSKSFHRGNQNPSDYHLQRAMDALDVVGPGLDVTRMLPDDIAQRLLNERINQQNMANWRNGASRSEHVHLQAYSAIRRRPWSLPRAVQDALHLSSTERVREHSVPHPLGVDFMDSGMPCCFRMATTWTQRGLIAFHVWREETLPRCTMGTKTFTSISVSGRG